MTVLTVVKSQVRAYRALWLWIRGRHFPVDARAVVITSRRGSMVMPAAFAVATVIEIAVLHLLLPWVWLQMALAILSIWSLITLFGHLAVHRTNPHYLTDSSVVLRQSGTVVATIERANIVRAMPRHSYSETAPTVIGERMFLPNADGTNVDIVLRRAVAVTLPALVQSQRKAQDVARISLYVDEPARLVTLISEQPSVGACVRARSKS